MSILFVSATHYFPGCYAYILTRKMYLVTAGFLQVPFIEDFLSRSVKFLPDFSAPRHYVKEDEVKDDWS